MKAIVLRFSDSLVSKNSILANHSKIIKNMGHVRWRKRGLLVYPAVTKSIMASYFIDGVK